MALLPRFYHLWQYTSEKSLRHLDQITVRKFPQAPFKTTGCKRNQKTAVSIRPRFCVKITLLFSLRKRPSGKRNRLSRANVHASPAVAANIRIDGCFFIFNLDRIQRTSLNTLAATIAGFLVYNRCHRTPPDQLCQKRIQFSVNRECAT